MSQCSFSEAAYIPRFVRLPRDKGTVPDMKVLCNLKDPVDAMRIKSSA
jgi:hypothetical protein